MMNRVRAAAGIAAGLWLLLGPGLQAQTRKEAAVTMHASGTFEVKLAPEPADAADLGRMSIDK